MVQQLKLKNVFSQIKTQLER